MYLKYNLLYFVHSIQYLMKISRPIYCTNGKAILEAYLYKRAHREKVCKHGGQTLCQATLSYETQLQLSQTYGIISFFPIPARDVQQMSLGK